eukprot:661407-Amphidinium_carterae.1
MGVLIGLGDLKLRLPNRVCQFHHTLQGLGLTDGPFWGLLPPGGGRMSMQPGCQGGGTCKRSGSHRL